MQNQQRFTVLKQEETTLIDGGTTYYIWGLHITINSTNISNIIDGIIDYWD